SDIESADRDPSRPLKLACSAFRKEEQRRNRRGLRPLLWSTPPMSCRFQCPELVFRKFVLSVSSLNQERDEVQLEPRRLRLCMLHSAKHSFRGSGPADVRCSTQRRERDWRNLRSGGRCIESRRVAGEPPPAIPVASERCSGHQLYFRPSI